MEDLKNNELNSVSNLNINPDIGIVDKEATDQIVKGFGISVFCSYLIASGFHIVPYLPPFSNDSLLIFILSYIAVFITSLALMVYSFCLFASATRRIYLSFKKSTGKQPSLKAMKSFGIISGLLFQGCLIIVSTNFFIELL